MEIETDNKGMKQTLTLDVINRKVEGKEKITTPAGSWDCYKITNSTKMKIKVMGIGMPINIGCDRMVCAGIRQCKSPDKGW